MKHRLLILCVTLLLSACAVNKPNEGSRSPTDPWEPLNRHIFGFNQGIDTVIFKPLAKGYEFIFPRVIRLGVTNFSRNLRMPLVAINNLLQGKGGAAANDTGRFLLNSTAGLLGILDPATPAGLHRNDEDFGQTFAVWGMPDGPFVVVPFLGPRTLRGAVAIPLNIAADPLLYYDNSSARDKIYGVRLIDVRQRLFAVEALIKESPDRYVTIRESFQQRRQFLIFDGNPPIDEDFYDEFDDVEED